MDTSGDEIETLLTTYNELNSSAIETLHEEPSPLEFMRYVARNTPFVVRGAASNWKASQKWSADYLRTALHDTSVNVAVTPYGYSSPVLPSHPTHSTDTHQQRRLPNPPPRHHHPRLRQTPRGTPTLP